MDMVKVELLANNNVFICCVVIQIIPTALLKDKQQRGRPQTASTPLQKQCRPLPLLSDPYSDLLGCPWCVDIERLHASSRYTSNNVYSEVHTGRLCNTHIWGCFYSTHCRCDQTCRRGWFPILCPGVCVNANTVVQQCFVCAEGLKKTLCNLFQMESPTFTRHKPALGFGYLDK